MKKYYKKNSLVLVFFVIIILLFQIISTTFNLTQLITADENTPEYKNNGWWNTTKGKDWIIDTTGNVWVNKNISVKGSILLKSGGTLKLQNCTVIVNTNLIINFNASLNLINTTLKFNATQNGSAELLVRTGGSIFISDYDNNPATKEDGTNITSNITDNNHRFLFFVDYGANFTMRNSELHQCGYWIFVPEEYGLYIRTNNSIIENNMFSNNYAGLVIESPNNTIRNNLFKDNDRYGLLIFMGRNNTLDNNTINNNRFNFGIFLNDLNQSNNITIKNTIDARPIYYFERIKDLNFSAKSEAGFIGLINSSNITVSNQYLINNFEGLLIMGVNNSIIKNIQLNKNIFGTIVDQSGHIIFLNCTISNNTDIGINFINSCCDIQIHNSTFKNNSLAMVISNSEIVIYNSTINNNKISDFQLENGAYIKVINCTVNPNKVQISGASKFEAQQYLHIRTSNHNNLTLGNISVNIYDGNNNHVNTITTNSSGYKGWIPCTSYVIKSSGKANSSMTNHRLHVSFSGMDFYQYVNMNKSQSVIIILNHQPEITNPPLQSLFIEEETYFYWDFNYTDGDGDQVTWHYTSNANWLNPIGLNTGILNGTPQDLDIGTFYINISCNDSYNGRDFHNFTMIVNNTNDAPEITSKQNAENAFEDKFYLHDFDVFDPDPGDSHTWSINTNAKWLSSINKISGTIYGTPTQSQVGDYFVNITVQDSELETDSHNFTLIVYPVNDAPVITNRENKSIMILEDHPYYHNFDFYDTDMDKVVWFLTTNASWLNEFNNITGELGGIPRDFDVGFFFVNISCIDANNSMAYQNFSIEVKNTNDPPAFLPIAKDKFYALEDTYFELSFKSTDPDQKDIHEFSLYKRIIKSRLTNNSINDSGYTPGEWLQLVKDQKSKSCKVVGVPTNDDVGEIFVELTCFDIKEASACINFSIIINNSNDAPWVTNCEDNLTFAKEDYKYYHDFDFIDIDADQVTWSMHTNAYWLTGINNQTGELSGVPTQDDLGKYYVNVICIDPFGEEGAQNFTIQVNNTNDPPIILNPGPDIVHVFEHEFYYWDFNSTDLDSNIVYWTSYSNAPWLNKIDRFTGIINGTPGDRDIGEFYVNISCMDDQLNSTLWNYIIKVINVNDPPIVTNGYLAPRFIDVDKQYYFKFEFSDIDDETVNWSIKTDAGLWLDFDANKALISGTPNRINIGTYYVNITCQDPHDAAGSFLFNIRVRGTENRAPELSKGYVSPFNGNEDTTFTFYVTYRDLDYHKPTVVGVMIGDTPLFLEPYDGDDLFIGIVYSNSTKLSEGSYSFYFYAKDELNAMANIIDNTTPSIENPMVISVEKLSDDEKSDVFSLDRLLEMLKDPFCFIIFIVFIIIILSLIIFSVVKHKHKKKKHITKKPLEPQLKEPKKVAEVTMPDASEDQILDQDEPPEIDKLFEEEPEEMPVAEPEDAEVEPSEEILEPGEEISEPSQQPKQIMICPECGEFVDETNKNCPGCGVRFSFEELEETAQDTAVSDEPESSELTPDEDEDSNELYEN